MQSQATRSQPTDRIVAALRGSRPAKIALSALSGLLLLGAVGLLGYPFFTNLYQSRLQSRLVQQLKDPQLAQAYRNHAVPIGDSLTRLEIPAIGVDVVVVEGTTEEALKAGAGHYPGTPLPCQMGDVAIAGHRTTYGRPFTDVDRLKVGDKITLVTPVDSCTYIVDQAPFVVLPTDTSVVANTPGQYTLTLTSCTPKGSASHRIIIKAAMATASSQA
ncbi:MAG TPA: class E sortase [Acidimicrobiales bacterium]|nr:class E sortase [Acidimicrobiales bacterium]